MEDLNLHLINSRKLGVRAIVTLHAWIEELCDLAVPMEIRGESDVAVKRQEYRVVELAVQKKMCCVSKRSLRFRPASRNCMRFSGRIWKCAVSISALRRGRVSAQGELFLSSVCTATARRITRCSGWSRRSRSRQKWNARAAFSEMIPRIESTLGQTTLEIQPDSDGEERALQAEAVLELDICLYQEETVSLLQDVYHPHRECIPKVQEETLRAF